MTTSTPDPRGSGEACASAFAYGDSWFRCQKTAGHDPLHGYEEGPISVTWDDASAIRVTTPEPAVSPAPDTEALRNQLARAISEQWLDDESLRGRTDYYSLADAVLPIIAEREAKREAQLRADLIEGAKENAGLRAEIERLAGMRALYRQNWQGARDANNQALETIARLERELARVSGDRTIPDDAAERIATVLSQWVEIEGPHEPEVQALTALFRSWLSAPTTGPAPAAADRPRWVQRGLHHHRCAVRAGAADCTCGVETAAPQAPAEPANCPRCGCAAPFHKTWCEDTAPAARGDTAPPAWTGHEVDVRIDVMGWGTATCQSGCGVIAEGLADVTDPAVDTHRADTLRPTGPLTPIQSEEV